MTESKDKTEIDEIGCLEAIEGLYAYLDGEIDDPETMAKIEHHLGHCRSCYSRTGLERALTERIRKSAKDRAPERLQHRMKELIEKF